MKRISTILLGAVLLLTADGKAQEREGYRLVTSAANPITSLTIEEVSAIFLKTTTRWEHGGKALPVDQLAQSEVRKSFSEIVHGKDVRAIETYWQTQLFSGRITPPPELASDAEVLRSVRSHAGAVGYVSRGTFLGDGVNAISISR